MPENPKELSASGLIVLLSLIGNAIVLTNGLTVHARWYMLLWLTIPLFLVALFPHNNKVQ